MPAMSDEVGSIFGIDSKSHIRKREFEGVERELFRANLGIAVNPDDISKFEDEYNEIMNDLFTKYGIDRIRKVYKSSEIGKFLGNESIIIQFHEDFARKILELPDVKFNICYTQLNSKYLKDGKVTIFGNYGGPTKKVDVKHFLNIIDNYYNVICGWKIIQITRLQKCTFLFDGMEDIYPSIAWDSLSKRNNVKIIFGGDKTEPVISAADILLKFVDYSLKKYRARLDEKSIKKIVTFDGFLTEKNKFCHYIGNKDINDIKPYENRRVTFQILNPFIRRPIIFISTGEQPKTKKILENLPIYSEIYDKAFGLQASVRIFNPIKDAEIIGKDPKNHDYFLPLTTEADEQYDLLVRGKSNIKKLEL